MNIWEFLSIFSRFQKITLEDFKNLSHVTDIYDFNRYPHHYFSESICANLNASWFDEILRQYELMQKQEITLLHPFHKDYPQEFLTLEKPPLYLSVKGDCSALTKKRVSVVGSRHPSVRVLEWMDIHLTPLVQTGAVLVSGAARGVDQRAHLICLRQSQPTIAFLPSGFLQVYPKDFQKWIPEILKTGGLILSEYLPNQAIHPHHFHERNRMIAKLGFFLLVCEARRKSGSIMTARLAIENSKTVCVLPSFPSESSNQGCLDLLFQGAFPIRDFQDLQTLTVPNHA